MIIIGFGDTDGLSSDKRTTRLFKNLFEGKNGIDSLDAVCLVVKSSDTRLDAMQRHNFNSVFQLFGKDIVKNVFIVATFSDQAEPPVKASLKDANIDNSKFFKFNNSTFFEGPKTDKIDCCIKKGSGILASRVLKTSFLNWINLVLSACPCPKMFFRRVINLRP